MEKTIKIGNEPYSIKYTKKTAYKVLDAVLAWMQERTHGASHSGEGICQNDECQIDSVALISDIVDDILKPVYLGEPDDDIF